MNIQNNSLVKPLMSEEEIKILSVLTHAIDRNMYIWPKLKIGDRIKPNISNSNTEFWNAYTLLSDHDISFVICDKTNFAPLLSIHPDSTPISHKAALDTVFSTLHIPILYINFFEYQRYKEAFEYESIRQKILDIIQR